MPSTFSTNTGLELIANGEQSATWGTTTNLNLEIIDRLTNGVGTITLSGTTHTLTTTDGTLSPGQFKVLVFGGSPSGTNTVTVAPNDQAKQYFVANNSGQDVVLTQGTGADVTITNGSTGIVYLDGAGAAAAVVELAVTTLTSLGITATAAELNVLDGVTATTAELNILDGVTATTAELNILDGVTATTAELNLLDGAVDTGVTPTLLQNSQSAAYTLVLSDSGKHILHPSADTTARTFTIPANGSVAFPIGTAVTFVNQVSAGVITIAITTDTMRLAGAGTTGSRTLAANGIATALKITGTQWIISGTGLT